jgi:DNA-binding IclR family transcriptional regulator
MLAHSPRATGIILSSPRVRLTDRTIVDAEALEREFAKIRSTGVAYDNGEASPDLVCIAAAVLGQHGQPVAALSMSGPRGLFVPESHEPLLRRLAFQASREIASWVHSAPMDVDQIHRASA